MSGEPLRDSIGRRMADRLRHYPEATKAEAVGLASAIGDKAAAEQLRIPRRNISRWRGSPSPEVQSAILRTRDDVAARLWEAVTAGTDAVLAGLRDPKARLGDKASALRIVMEAHQLITGGATARVESASANDDLFARMDHEERDQLRYFLRTMIDGQDDTLKDYLARGGIEELKRHFGQSSAEDAADG